MTENKRFRTGKGFVCGDYFSETIIDAQTNEKYYGGIKPDYISSKQIVELLNELSEENKQLKSIIKKVIELLSEEVDVFSEKAIEHDLNAYRELQQLDNKDAYCIAKATKKAITLLKEL